MVSPFRNTVTEKYIKEKSTLLRWEKTLRFLNSDSGLSRGLDLGDRTPLTNKLEALFNCPFDNTTIDLDIGFINGSYDVVTAFEVIEHLFNPLHCLLEVKKALKPNGLVYISTPIGKPNFLWSKDHFHEMSFRSLMTLLNRSGFKIIRKNTIRIHPTWFYFTGLRPFLRLIFEKHLLLELQSQPVSE